MDANPSQESPPAPVDTPGPTTMRPEGHLTVAEAKRFKSEVLERIDGNRQITVDLRHVERLDSAALQILIAAVRTGRCRVTELPDGIRTKLAQAGCLGLLGH
jgi:anti-anti-sigma regulatory factor